MCKVDSQANPYDERPLVDDLLEKHAKAIASVRESILDDDECKALYGKGDNTKRYDDIWILRYVLSHKGHVKSASKAAMNTIKFREESKLNQAGDLRHRIKQHGVPDSEKMANIDPLPGYKLYNKYCEENAICTTLPDENRGIVVYYDMGKMDQHGLATGMDTEQMKEMVLYANEAMFQVVDEITRRTGRLTKVMKIVDMSSTGFRKMNRAFLQRDGASSKASEDYYPQLLACIMVINGPTWLSTFWSLLRPVIPKRVAEKVDFLPSVAKMKGNQKALKSILKYVAEENLPEKYAGLNKQWPLPCVSERYVV